MPSMDRATATRTILLLAIQGLDAVGQQCLPTPPHLLHPSLRVYDDVGEQRPSRGTNVAPSSKLPGAQILQHSELPEIFLRLSLPLHTHRSTVCQFTRSYRGHIGPVGLKLPALTLAPFRDRS